jgi:hypothetical protein
MQADGETDRQTGRRASFLCSRLRAPDSGYIATLLSCSTARLHRAHWTFYFFFCSSYIYLSFFHYFIFRLIRCIFVLFIFTWCLFSCIFLSVTLRFFICSFPFVYCSFYHSSSLIFILFVSFFLRSILYFFLAFLSFFLSFLSIFFLHSFICLFLFHFFLSFLSFFIFSFLSYFPLFVLYLSFLHSFVPFFHLSLLVWYCFH